MNPSQARKCPRCHGLLERHGVGNLEIDCCPHCGDLWFDRSELAAYLAQRGAPTTGIDWAGVSKGVSAVQPLECPRCEEATLYPHEWEPLEFNRCRTCGGIHLTQRQLHKALSREILEDRSLEADFRFSEFLASEAISAALEAILCMLPW